MHRWPSGWVLAFQASQTGSTPVRCSTCHVILLFCWRGVGVVDRDGLENRLPARVRGFESLSLRKEGCLSGLKWGRAKALVRKDPQVRILLLPPFILKMSTLAQSEGKCRKVQYTFTNAPVAQLNRASRSYREGHRFESCQGYHLLGCNSTRTVRTSHKNTRKRPADNQSYSRNKGVYRLTLIRSRNRKWLHAGSNPVAPTIYSRVAQWLELSVYTREVVVSSTTPGTILRKLGREA